MQENIKIVLAFVKAGLKIKKIDIKIPDEKSFYILVRENGLIGIIFESIKKENVSETLYKRLERDFFEYVKKDTRQLLLHQKLKTVFNEANIDYIFLKGINLKYIYKKSYMRAMGDIDCLIKKDNLDKVHTCLNKNDIKCANRSIAHDVFKTIDNLEIEIHPGFLSDFNPKFDSLIKDPWKYSLLVQENEYRFDVNFEVSYLVYHLVKHMQLGGVGIRSILDIGVYLDYYKNDINEDLLLSILNEANMLKIFQTIVYLNQELFDFQFDLSLMNGFSMEPLLLDQLVEYISLSGIHGLGKDFNSFDARLATEKRKKKGKLGLLLNRMFPGLKEMRGIYPILKKWAILLPIFYIVRLFKLVFKDTKSNYNKIKRIKDSKNISSVDEMFKKIGI